MTAAEYLNTNRICFDEEYIHVDDAREYGIMFAIEQLETHLPSIAWNDDSEPSHDYNKGEVHCQRTFRNRLQIKIAELKSKLTP